MTTKRVSLPAEVQIVLLMCLTIALGYNLYQRFRASRGDADRQAVIVAPNVAKQIHGGQPLVGIASSAVLMTVFSDFQCGFCASLARSIDALPPSYRASVFVRYRHNPRSASHPHAIAAANASECAAEQGRFRAYHDELFRYQSQIGITTWTEFASTMRHRLDSRASQSISLQNAGRRCSALVGLGVLFVARLAFSMPARQPGDGTVRVVVIDDARLPVVGAEITLSSERRRAVSARTDSTGAAVIKNVPSGLWRIDVRRIGLKPVATTIRVAAGENAYTVGAENAALTLTGLRIVGGTSFAARLDDFERRRLAGVPSAVVTREEIDKLGPISLSRMLRGMSGIRVGDSLGNVIAISTRGAKPMRLPDRPGITMVQCVLRVAVDGVILPALSSIDQVVPGDVHGVEVYFGPARLPPELAALRTDNWCGIVAIWTRDR